MPDLSVKRFRYVSASDAVNITLNSFDAPPRRIKIVSIDKAFNEILAENIVVKDDVPPHNVSHFDGYAVDFRDLRDASPSNPVHLRVIGSVFPGDDEVPEIGSGEACYVATGAFIPRNANTIVPVEAVNLIDENVIEVRFPPKIGDHIISRGSDLRGGEVVFKIGRVLRAFDVGLLAFLGFEAVRVFVKPKIGVLSSGDELVSSRFTSHSLMLSYLIRRFCGCPVDLGVVRDDRSEIVDVIRKGLKGTDCIMTIGGCSRGVKDLLPDAVLSLSDSNMVLRGLKRVPGRQTSFAVVGGKPVLMLPGLCQSMVVGFYTLGVPIIKKLGGITSQLLFKFKAKVVEDFNASFMPPFERVFFVKLLGFNDLPLVHLVTGPSMHRSVLIKSNGFTVIPPFKINIKRGEIIEVTLF